MPELIQSQKKMNESLTPWRGVSLLAEKYDYSLFQDGILFLYPTRRTGAVVVIGKDNDSYSYAMMKKNNVIGSPVLGAAREHGASSKFDYIVSYAKQNDILKKITRGLSTVELVKVLVQKEGINLQNIKKIAPEASDALEQADESEFIPLGKMRIHGGAEFKNADAIVAFLKKGHSLLQKEGFGHLLYGDIFLIPQKLAKTILADYSPATDVIRLIANERAEISIIKTFLHELGHRQFHKFKVDKKALQTKYFETRREIVIHQIGTVFKNPDNNREMKIVDRKVSKGSNLYHAKYVDELQRPGYWRYSQSFFDNIEMPNKKEKSVFSVSAYAMTEVGEFWAEVFGYGIRDQQPELLAWIQEITKG